MQILRVYDLKESAGSQQAALWFAKSVIHAHSCARFLCMYNCQCMPHAHRLYIASGAARNSSTLHCKVSEVWIIQNALSIINTCSMHHGTAACWSLIFHGSCLVAVAARHARNNLPCGRDVVASPLNDTWHASLKAQPSRLVWVQCILLLIKHVCVKVVGLPVQYPSQALRFCTVYQTRVSNACCC